MSILEISVVSQILVLHKFLKEKEKGMRRKIEQKINLVAS